MFRGSPRRRSRLPQPRSSCSPWVCSPTASSPGRQLTAAVAGAIGVGGAALLRWRRWAGLGVVLAVAGLMAALIAIGARFVVVSAAGGAGIEPDLWAFAAVGIIVAIGIMALRSSASRAVSIVVGVTFSLALVLFAAAELILLGQGDGDEVRTVLTMSALTGAGIIGVVWRERLGTVAGHHGRCPRGRSSACSLSRRSSSDPVELVTVPPALGMLILGARSSAARTAARTWPTLGPGLALLTVPSLLYDFGATDLWRVVALGIVAIALVVVGAVWRLQAPLVLGSIVLLVHAVAQLWPWISAAYVAVPWWLWLGRRRRSAHLPRGDATSGACGTSARPSRRSRACAERGRRTPGRPSVSGRRRAPSPPEGRHRRVTGDPEAPRKRRRCRRPPPRRRGVRQRRRRAAPRAGPAARPRRAAALR